MPVAEVEAPEESSVELLREFERTGRPEPFEAFMRRHASMVYATCLKVTRDPHDAEDATQATFLTLASKSRLNGEIRQPEAWLRKVAHRLALDLIRSKKRRVNRENVRSEMNSEAAPLDSHDHADAGEVKGILNEELAKLPASYRMPLILHYFGGLSRDEMAAQLKLKPSTLGVRLHRGREQLRRRLAGRGIALPAVALTALLAESVRSSVCAHMMASTARQASAIAMGHAPAASMFGAPLLVGAGGRGLGSIGAILNLLSHGKLKLMLSALVVGSAISLTSARVQAFLPAALRAVLPTFRIDALLPPLLPRLDVRLPTPTLRSQSNDADDAATHRAARTALVSRPPSRPPIASAAAPSRPFAIASSVASANAASYGTTWSVPSGPAAIVGVAVPERLGTVRAVLPPLAVARSTPAAPSVPVSAAPRAGVRPAVVEEPTPLSDRGTSAGSHDPSRSGPWENVITANGSNASGPAAPAATASNEGQDAAVPDRVVAPVTGAPPALGGHAAGGNSGAASAGQADRDRSASLAKPAAAPRVLASRTAVFAGTSANYGGYADAAWKPTQLTDLNGTLDSAPAASGTSAAANGPAVPGEALSVNGARVTLHEAGKGGAIDVAFIDTTAAGIPAFPNGHHFIGVWSLDSTASFASADLLVRYDDLRAARLGLNEQVLKLWVSDGVTWSLMWLDPSFGRDINANLLWVSAPGDFKFFAVSAPEPTTAAVLTAGSICVLRRWRRV